MILWDFAIFLCDIACYSMGHRYHAYGTVLPFDGTSLAIHWDIAVIRWDFARYSMGHRHHPTEQRNFQCDIAVILWDFAIILWDIALYTLRKIRYLLLSQTLLGFLKAQKRTRKVSDSLGTVREFPIVTSVEFLLECIRCNNVRAHMFTIYHQRSSMRNRLTLNRRLSLYKPSIYND